MERSQTDTPNLQTDCRYLLRWFCGTLLGICGAGGCLACLIGGVFADKNSDGWWSAETLQCFLSGGGLALIAGVPACVLGCLCLHARSSLPGEASASERQAWSLICGGGAGAVSLLPFGLPAGMIVAALLGAVGGFSGCCVLDLLVESRPNPGSPR
ncbi:hypothetical protein LBMAG46_14760 [Planctomycetia bacterium]|nr:hypothetical protein LBMAG46_14760 [Planctomycetia bacterium]